MVHTVTAHSSRSSVATSSHPCSRRRTGSYGSNSPP
ncbi:hypothetical protein X975_10927, partial [Stegodyphus mimosarum]